MSDHSYGDFNRAMSDLKLFSTMNMYKDKPLLLIGGTTWRICTKPPYIPKIHAIACNGQVFKPE